MGKEATSITTYTILAVLVLLSSMIVNAVSGIPVLGAFGGLLLGLVFVGAGWKTFDMDIEEIDDVGTTLVSLSAMIVGLGFVFATFGINILNAIPSWLGLGAAGLGLILTSWHWFGDQLKL